MVKASKAGSAELVIIMSYPTSPSGIIVLLKNAQKISRILPDLGGCYLPRPKASTDNSLLDLHNSS